MKLCDSNSVCALSMNCVQVSRLLSVVENGCINKWRGQNLSDINYDGKQLFMFI